MERVNSENLVYHTQMQRPFVLSADLKEKVVNEMAKSKDYHKKDQGILKVTYGILASGIALTSFSASLRYKQIDFIDPAITFVSTLAALSITLFVGVFFQDKAKEHRELAKEILLFGHEASLLHV